MANRVKYKFIPRTDHISNRISGYYIVEIETGRVLEGGQAVTELNRLNEIVEEITELFTEDREGRESVYVEGDEIGDILIKHEIVHLFQCEYLPGPNLFWLHSHDEELDNEADDEDEDDYRHPRR